MRAWGYNPTPNAFSYDLRVRFAAIAIERRQLAAGLC